MQELVRLCVPREDLYKLSHGFYHDSYDLTRTTSRGSGRFNMTKHVVSRIFGQFGSIVLTKLRAVIFFYH